MERCGRHNLRGREGGSMLGGFIALTAMTLKYQVMKAKLKSLEFHLTYFIYWAQQMFGCHSNLAPRGC